MSKVLSDLSVQIFADGADKDGMLSLYANPLIKGLTTNPTLMRKAGISDYETFAKDVLAEVKTKPISFEVFSDDIPEMERQAHKIASWGENVFIKIPITNTQGLTTLPIIKSLSQNGVKLNITAILTEEQVSGVAAHLNPGVPSVVSVFAGRIADTGRDPIPMMKRCLEVLRPLPCSQLLWASVREVLNIFHAEESGARIVTVPHDILTKALKMAGQDLAALSLETVKMFASDAVAAGFKLEV